MGRSREGYRQPEERTLADLLVGHRIILQYAVGPDPDPDDPDREITGPTRARTGAYWLHAVSNQGLEISRALAGEDAEIFLVPWGGVLVLNGVPRAARGGGLQEVRHRPPEAAGPSGSPARRGRQPGAGRP